jgi:hypothetical protein
MKRRLVDVRDVDILAADTALAHHRRVPSTEQFDPGDATGGVLRTLPIVDFTNWAQMQPAKRRVASRGDRPALVGSSCVHGYGKSWA